MAHEALHDNPQVDTVYSSPPDETETETETATPAVGQNKKVRIDSVDSPVGVSSDPSTSSLKTVTVPPLQRRNTFFEPVAESVSDETGASMDSEDEFMSEGSSMDDILETQGSDDESLGEGRVTYLGLFFFFSLSFLPLHFLILSSLTI